QVDGASRGRGDENLPVLGVAAHAQCEQGKRWKRERALRGEQHVSLAIAVGDDATELAADEHRGELNSQDQAHEKTAVRELQRELGHGDALHPRADRGDDLSGQEQPVVAVPERSQHADWDRSARHRLGDPHLGDDLKMTKLRETVDIDAPAERVWAVVHEDVLNATRWTTNLDKVEKLDDGPPGIGTRYRYHLDLPGGIKERL